MKGDRVAVQMKLTKPGARGGCSRATPSKEAKQVLSIMEQEISNCHIAVAGSNNRSERISSSAA
jgi:hypothetical protein